MKLKTNFKMKVHNKKKMMNNNIKSITIYRWSKQKIMKYKITQKVN